jgi:hypothetical protein
MHSNLGDAPWPGPRFGHTAQSTILGRRQPALQPQFETAKSQNCIDAGNNSGTKLTSNPLKIAKSLKITDKNDHLSPSSALDQEPIRLKLVGI